VFLVVYNSRRNVIDTVDKIKATLPRLVAAIRRPAIKIDIISDRTQPSAPRWRRAVHAASHHRLVVMVTHFPAQLWATVIPTVTVPLALLGACALMWCSAIRSTICRGWR